MRKIVIWTLFFVVASVICLSLVTSNRQKRQMKAYYSDPDNMITESCEIGLLSYYEDFAVLHFSFDPEDHSRSSDQDYIIKGDNFRVLQQNGFREEVHVGDEVIVSYFPGVFYDGYQFPIVGITKGDRKSVV